MRGDIRTFAGRARSLISRRSTWRDVQLPRSGYPPSKFDTLPIDALPDSELDRLNGLLPWAAFTVDGRGRRFGNAYSSTKRTVPQEIPDKRIVELDQRVGLAGCRVLEVGCFEGIHTAALCSLGADVTAIDSRIENVVKTVVRCALLGYHPSVLRLDLEEPLPSHVDLACDVLHHVGVLYHLTDPVGHLVSISALTQVGLMLDTHVAPEDDGGSERYSSHGEEYRYHRFSEAGRKAPFAGMQDHAKWLHEADIVDLLRSCGFADVDVAERRSERNGPRVLIYAQR